MKPENRAKSIKKWAQVLKYFDAHQYMKAYLLASSQERCGHCLEYEEDCKKCPLGHRGRNGYRCHDTICEIVDDVGEMRYSSKEAKAEMRKKILKAQRLVRTK